MSLDALQALDHGIEIGPVGYGWSSRTSNSRSSGFGEASVGAQLLSKPSELRYVRAVRQTGGQAAHRGDDAGGIPE
jgi:hypothetical protein